MVTGEQTVKSWETLGVYGHLDKHLLEPPASHIQVRSQTPHNYTCCTYIRLYTMYVLLNLNQLTRKLNSLITV